MHGAVDDSLRAALSERYELVRQIGQGGMATVYLARELERDRYVAVNGRCPSQGAGVTATCAAENHSASGSSVRKRLAGGKDCTS